MKKIIFVLFIILINRNILLSQVAINMDGTTPNNSAMLDVKSNNKGFLPPRMARVEINAIASPADGLIVYCTDCGPNGAGALSMFMAGTWFRLSATNMDPMVSTTTISAITSSTASSGGNVISDGGSMVIARGVCWGTSPNPIIANSKTSDGTGIGIFTSSLTGLTANTTYYVRAYSTTSAGTGYGNEVSFKTLVNEDGIIFNPDLTYGTMTDIDGNVYKTITIGTQTWMAENLKTTKYRNGESIPNVTDFTAWSGLTSGAYCWYNNDVTNKATYGGLYNWYAVADIRNIAPTGWHIPTFAEWTTLTTYLGGETESRAKLQESGKTHWLTSDVGVSNSSGFTALPGGGRDYGSSFYAIGKGGFWWSSTSDDSILAWGRNLDSNFQPFNFPKQYGFSVRCVKDPPFSVPNITTTLVMAITASTAISGGNITSDGGATVTARGVCWNTAHNPTTASSKTTDGTGTGSFTSSLTGLLAGTTYYIKAYATNSSGTSYGEEQSFTTTSASLPTVTVASIRNIAHNSVSIAATIPNDGGSAITGKGVCWSTTPNPTIEGNKTSNGTGNGNFESSIVGLTVNTTYYLRAYATNSGGVAYSDESSFKTLNGSEIATIEMLDIENTNGIYYNNTSYLYPTKIVYSKLTKIVNRGIYFTNTNNIVELDFPLLESLGSSLYITGNLGLKTISAPKLMTIYNNLSITSNPVLDKLVMCSLTDIYCDGEGSEPSINFSNNNANLSTACLSSVKLHGTQITLDPITSFSFNTAIVTGSLIIGCSQSMYYVCWDTSPNPKRNNALPQKRCTNDNGTLSCTIPGLTPNTKYYVRFYNDREIYSDEFSFTTLP